MGTSTPLDVDRIKMIRGLDNKGDSLLGRLVEVFASEAAKTIDALHAADEQHDRPALRQGAHRLRGSAANLGAPSLAAACEDLEGIADDASVTHAALSSLVAEIERELERAVEALRAEVGRAK